MLGKLWNQNGSDAVLECREGGYITGLCSEIIQLTTTNSLQLFNQASSATIVFYHDYHHHDQQLYIERSSEPRGKRFNQKTGSKGLWIGTRTVYQGQGNSIVDQHGHQPTPITQNNFLLKGKWRGSEAGPRTLDSTSWGCKRLRQPWEEIIDHRRRERIWAWHPCAGNVNGKSVAGHQGKGGQEKINDPFAFA